MRDEAQSAACGDGSSHLIDWPDGLGRREFLRSVGGGLLVLCGWRPSLTRGQEGGVEQPLTPDLKRGERPADEVAAWLHIAGDGQVTVYTGKVEIGQNVRTSLAQGVCEELRVPFESVRLVMGDTAQVPDDVGTFGSLSTPVMFAQLRRASASAREYLLDEAAKSLAVAREELAAESGMIRHGPSGRALSYGELTKGRELIKAVAENPALTPEAEWKVAGTSCPKVNGVDLVTGRHRFASDLKTPGMLQGKVLRAPALGQKLAALDDSKVVGLAEVRLVREEDFVGVVARDQQEAEAALAQLVPTWEGEPHSVTSRNLHDHLRQKAKPGSDDARSLIVSGSLEKGMSEAALEWSASYSSAYIAHVPLEPRACVAQWDGDQLTVWTGTQVPFGIRRGLADRFDLEPEQVRVIVPDTGSGYGGKHRPDMEIEAARLARASGTAVRLSYSREDEFTQGYCRPAGVADVKAGVRADHTLCCWEFHNINSGVAGLDTPYEVAHKLCQFQPSDSPLNQGAYRALASTFNHFARESMIDELARACELDPLAFRLLNLKNERMIEALLKVAERFDWKGRRPATGAGFGIAGGFDKGAAIASCAEVKIDEESGELRVVRLITALGPGSIVNSDHMACQVEGASLMALGGALFEQVEFASGKIRNSRLSRYRVPRFTDLPKLEAVLIDRREITAAGGGEIGMVCVAPAIANAIEDASGVRLRSLPLVPDGWKAR